MIAAAQSADANFGAGEMLAALLGVEGLLLAAVAISVSLAASTRLGNRWKVSPANLAVGNTVILGLITLGAGLIWVQLFGGSAWPSDCELRAGALALALAVLAPVAISLTLAVNLKCK